MAASRSLVRAGLIALAWGMPAALGAQAMPELPPQPPQLPPAPLDVEPGSPFVIYPIRGGMFMISGPASNVAVQVGIDGVVVVDSGTAEMAEGLLAQIRRLSKKPILYILNTNGDDDHAGGNTVISAGGVTLAGTANTRPDTVPGSAGSPIFAHENVMNRLVEGGTVDGLPTQTYFVEQKDLFYNGEPV
jgi:glyoxylase-like metal-dependent hydrolase (beta-lactamase superfamily II)